MTKDVILSICGFQFETGGDEPVEIITGADYFFKNGKHYVLYDEMLPESGEEVKNIIKISSERVDVLRKGPQSTHMVFETDKKNMTYYSTPFGKMMIGINTTNIDCKEDDLNIEAKINYALDVNYTHVSDCEITVNIKSKDDKTFRLLEKN